MAEQNLPGAYENPYRFNAKELDRETNLYYYGARYYNPRLSIWYGVDPLAVYNPVMETEFYGDGQHNGGVGFWGNLNPYIYTYQSPVVYVDPNGKQAKFETTLYSKKYFNYTPPRYNATRAGLHTALDTAGLIPVYGEIFDGINAAWYGLEGDYVNSGLSAAAMIPILGYGASGVKWISKGLKISENTGKLIKAVGKSGKDGGEVVLKTHSNTFADAKKIAQEITGVGDDAADYISRAPGSPLSGKVVGKKEGSSMWRLDIDKATGDAHINYTTGKGNKGRIDFGGGERNVKSIINNVLNK